MQKPSEPVVSRLPWWRDPMYRVVHAVGITQITAWGTAFYCLGVLAHPIADELGFSRSFVFLGFTIAMLMQGLVSTHIGRLVDQWGGRQVMSIGVVLIAIGLAALAMVSHWLAYLAAAEDVWARRMPDGDSDAFLDALTACCESLVGRARDAVNMFYREGLGREQVAAALGMTADGVKTLLRRTRDGLRQCIERSLQRG